MKSRAGSDANGLHDRQPASQLAAGYLMTFGAFSVGVIENANQVFQPDDRF
jgi:hypothetical protein